MIASGGTVVLCTALVEKGVPEWRESSGHGWMTAEYDMLPGATAKRRARNRTKLDGRTQEIQRLIGRALRVTVDLTKIGQHTIFIDCDVLQADGGTRTAAITGAYVALCDALRFGRQTKLWPDDPLLCGVAAVSVGNVGGRALLDLDYSEDVAAEVDANLVLTTRGEWVEVQATGERATFDDAALRMMMDLGRRGIQQLFEAQCMALGESGGGA